MKNPCKQSVMGEINSQVVEITGFTAKQMFWGQVIYAERYLKEIMKVDHWGCLAVMESTAFWDWWLSFWIRRDELFLKEMLRYHDYLHDREWVREQYREIHNPATLDAYPFEPVAEDAYEQLICNLVKHK